MMKEKQINFRETAIHYKTIGKGTPVILIHGFAEDSSIWDKQVEYLQNDLYLIIPDLPGSGRSALIDKEGTGIDDYAAVIRQILLEEKVDHCIMIGHSMGGYITLAYAEKFMSSLLAFGLFHSGAYADDEAKVETRKKAIGFIETNGQEAFLKTSIPGLFFDQEDTRLADDLVEKGKAFSAKALIQYYRAMIARPDRTKVLADSPVPVLFILGEHDKAIPYKQGLEQSHMPRQSQLHVLRNSAHMGMLEEPGKANRALKDFLLSPGN